MCFNFLRVFKINLKCDAAIKNPGESDGVKENQVALKDSIYVGTLITISLTRSVCFHYQQGCNEVSSIFYLG